MDTHKVVILIDCDDRENPEFARWSAYADGPDGDLMQIESTEFKIISTNHISELSALLSATQDALLWFERYIERRIRQYNKDVNYDATLMTYSQKFSKLITTKKMVYADVDKDMTCYVRSMLTEYKFEVKEIKVDID